MALRENGEETGEPSMAQPWSFLSSVPHSFSPMGLNSFSPMGQPKFRAGKDGSTAFSVPSGSFPWARRRFAGARHSGDAVC